MFRRLIATSALLLGLVLGLDVASGHTSLSSSNPKPDANLKASPKEITLRFNEDLLVLKSKSINQVKVVSTGGNLIAGTTKTSRSKLIFKLSENLKEGSYQVFWRAVSGDGHVVQGNFKFNLI